MNPAKAIFVALADGYHDGRIKRTLQHTGRCWVYLGKSYSELLRYETLLGKDRNVSISAAVYREAIGLRSAYVSWIAEIGRRYGDSLVWWTSGLAGRNTENSDLFLNLCYLNLSLKLAQNKTETSLLFIVEDWALALSLFKNLKHMGFEPRTIGSHRFWQISGLLRDGLYFVARWFNGLYTLLKQRMAAYATLGLEGDLGTRQSPKPIVLLHTCVDEACLGTDGTFKDRYFTKLPQWLRANGFDVWTLVWPFHFARPLNSAFKWFRLQKERFVIPEDYFQFRDYPSAIACILRQFFLASDIEYFGDLSVYPMLLRERLRQASDAGKVRFLLYPKVIRRLTRGRLRISYYIDMFENMAPEKPILKEVNSCLPLTMTYGFQHASISPLMLKYFLDEDEVRRVRSLFPKKIISNGLETFKILTECGYPQEDICVAPAFRYLHLFGKSSDKSVFERNIILVTLPLMLDNAIEILGIIFEIAASLPCKVAIKPHPMMNRVNLLASMRIDQLPVECIWAEGGMDEWLDKAMCVIGGGTASVLETVFAGVPVVLIGRKVGLDLNPLGWWEKDIPMFRCCYESTEVQERILHWCSATPEQRAKEMSEAKGVIAKCFQPWDEKLLHALFPKDTHAS